LRWKQAVGRQGKLASANPEDRSNKAAKLVILPRADMKTPTIIKKKAAKGVCNEERGVLARRSAGCSDGYFPG